MVSNIFIAESELTLQLFGRLRDRNQEGKVFWIDSSLNSLFWRGQIRSACLQICVSTSLQRTGCRRVACSFYSEVCLGTQFLKEHSNVTACLFFTPELLCQMQQAAGMRVLSPIWSVTLLRDAMFAVIFSLTSNGSVFMACRPFPILRYQNYY